MPGFGGENESELENKSGKITETSKNPQGFQRFRFAGVLIAGSNTKQSIGYQNVWEGGKCIHFDAWNATRST